MAQIIPAILPQNFEEIEDKASRVAPYVNLIQVDICDGKFVSNTTWPYNKGSEDSFKSILKEQTGMPHWDSIDYEFDLMVSEPEKVFEQYVSLGASRIIIHLKSVSHDSLTQLLSVYGKKGGYMSMFDVEIGLALTPDTDIKDLGDLIEHFHFVQVMGISKVGFQGQPFDSGSISLIKSLRELHPELILSVDGGVSLDNAKLLVEAGADRLVVGSALFKTDNLIATLEAFESL